jgi:hypothetical protein
MAEFNKMDIDLAFFGMTSQLEAELPHVLPPHELPVVVRHGQRVALNLLEGEEVREDLLTAYADVKSVLNVTVESPVTARSFYMGTLDRAFSEVLWEQRHNNDFGTLFVVRGTSLFEHTSSAVTGPVYDWLAPSETLFGTLNGAAPRIFPYVTTERLLAATGGDRSVNLNPQATIGGLLCLGNVEVCRGGDSEECGPVERTYEEVMLPITNRDIQYFRGYPQH